MALKARAVSQNWSQVKRLLERTLFSVCNQTDPEYQVIVVCNEIPRIRLSSNRVRFVVLDILPPQARAGNENILDKYIKLQRGLIAAKTYNPDFIMIMDADDLVSRQLSDFVRKRKDSNGWMFNKGWSWQENSRWLFPVNNFHYMCGTSAIVNAKLIEFPKAVTEEEFKKCIVLTNGHNVIAETMQSLHRPLEPLPFPGAIYVRGHGENDSVLRQPGQSKTWYGLRHFLGSLRQRRLFSKSMKKEFGLL